jgi:hypothetical protein
VSWDAIATFALVAATIAGINIGAIKWMLDRQRGEMNEDTARWSDIERAMLELRAALPLEYVRREDWIRFSGTLDAKLDAMRDEMREENSIMKERLYGGRN